MGSRMTPHSLGGGGLCGAFWSVSWLHGVRGQSLLPTTDRTYRTEPLRDLPSPTLPVEIKLFNLPELECHIADTLAV